MRLVTLIGLIDLVTFGAASCGDDPAHTIDAAEACQLAVEARCDHAWRCAHADYDACVIRAEEAAGCSQRAASCDYGAAFACIDGWHLASCAEDDVDACANEEIAACAP